MKTFDFNHTDFKKHHPKVQEFLRKAQKSGMAESAFVAVYKKLPRPDGKSKKSRRCPSMLKQHYYRLKRDFNFF